jgi:hypothetical protein
MTSFNYTKDAINVDEVQIFTLLLILIHSERKEKLRKMAANLNKNAFGDNAVFGRGNNFFWRISIRLEIFPRLFFTQPAYI